MDVFEELRQYAELVPYDRLVKVVKTPMSVFPEKISVIIPSIELGSDGPILGHLFLVTAHYLCDLVIHPEPTESFDFISVNSIKNYRFELGEHIAKGADDREINYQTACVSFIHDLGADFRSRAYYVGSDRESWIQLVIKSLPLSLII